MIAPHVLGMGDHYQLNPGGNTVISQGRPVQMLEPCYCSFLQSGLVFPRVPGMTLSPG